MKQRNDTDPDRVLPFRPRGFVIEREADDESEEAIEARCPGVLGDDDLIECSSMVYCLLRKRKCFSNKQGGVLLQCTIRRATLLTSS